MRWGATLSLVLALAGCSGDSGAPPHQLKVSRIDSEAVASAMPVSKPDLSKSGDGRRRMRWTLADAGPGGILEAIGDVQSDADQISMVCAQFDAAGNMIPAIRPDSYCLKLMGQFFGRFVLDGNRLARELLEQEQRGGVVAGVTLGDFSFDTWQGFSAVRRYSRMRRH